MTNMTHEESLQRINVAVRMGDTRQAEKMLVGLIREKPDLVQAYLLLAGVYGRIGRDSDAVKLLQRAVKLDPGNPDVYNTFGVLYRNTGDNRKALSALKKAFAQSLAQRTTGTHG